MKNKLSVICSLAALAALISSSEAVIERCRYALSLCAELIIPSLFPFFIVSILLNRLGFPAFLGQKIAPAARRLFRVSGTGSSALIIGLTGGYPLGAAYIADMAECGAVSKDEAERLLGFCNNSGPAFIIGAVGSGVFGSAKAGIYLYAIHIVSAVFTGMIMKKGTEPHRAELQQTEALPVSQALPDAVRQALVSILNVCGFVICFTVLAGLLDTGGLISLAVGRAAAATGLEMHWLRALFIGSLELGSGVGTMRGLGLNAANLALAAFLLGWGGISVHFQTKALFAGSNIKDTLHFAGRLLSAGIAAVCAYFMFRFIF